MPSCFFSQNFLVSSGKQYKENKPQEIQQTGSGVIDFFKNPPDMSLLYPARYQR